jgi:hypothetical protein
MEDFGTRTSVKKTSPNSLSPLICLSGRASTPSACMSMSSIEMPACRGASGLVRTIAKIQSPCMALVVQTFWPLTSQWSPMSSALHCSAARSEPAPGSEKPWHQMTRLNSRSGMIVFFWSSVPNTITLGARNVSPSGFTVYGTDARTVSSS